MQMQPRQEMVNCVVSQLLGWHTPAVSPTDPKVGVSDVDSYSCSLTSWTHCFTALDWELVEPHSSIELFKNKATGARIA